jgi:hypothetical protein
LNARVPQAKKLVKYDGINNLERVKPSSNMTNKEDDSNTNTD